MGGGSDIYLQYGGIDTVKTGAERLLGSGAIAGR
jgi:hypothetical protein